MPNKDLISKKILKRILVEFREALSNSLWRVKCK